MKALSIKQPWAWLIAKGYKDVENRSWSTKYRGRIYIHASKSKTDMSQEVYAYIFRRLNYQQRCAFENNDLSLVYGAIIGEVDIVDCVMRYAKPPACFVTRPSSIPYKYSEWHEVGCYGIVLANAVMYDEPIPYRGQQGLFEVRLP